MPEPVLVVGAGCAGLVAALAAAKQGAAVELFDIIDPLSADEKAESNTARSTGLIPAAGTSLQRAAGIADDSPELQAADIIAANKGCCDVDLVKFVCNAAAPTVEWLSSDCGIDLICFTDFLYHGHSKYRMHGPPSGYGRSLVQMLARRVQEHDQIGCHYGTEVTGLIVENDSVVGLRSCAGDFRGCAVILATCGFGASSEMVSKYIDSTSSSGVSSVMASAWYQGSPHNDGSGLLWGEAAGGELQYMGSYQGHATVTDSPEPKLITYGVIVNGGILVNAHGERFGNENVGYSEFSAAVLAQGPGVVEVFGEATFTACRGTRLSEVEDAGLILRHETLEALAMEHQLPLEPLRSTIAATNAAVEAGSKDEQGRPWTKDGTAAALVPPFFSIRVRGALFHTQGGLRVNSDACVVASSGPGGGAVIPGLLAAGGAAAGVSGETVEGYLSGNGLLTAAVYGKAAGDFSAAAYRSQS